MGMQLETHPTTSCKSNLFSFSMYVYVWICADGCGGWEPPILLGLELQVVCEPLDVDAGNWIPLKENYVLLTFEPPLLPSYKRFLNCFIVYKLKKKKNILFLCVNGYVHVWKSEDSCHSSFYSVGPWRSNLGCQTW